MLRKSFFTILFTFIFLTLVFSAAAQKRNRKKVPPKKTAAVQTKTPVKEAEIPIPEKKNSRPVDENSQSEENIKPEPGKKNSKTETSKSPGSPKQSKLNPVYFYEFSQPEFTISKIYIEHDESGKGTIRFMKKFYDEEISDPIALSADALERVKTLWQDLNFLDSDENYQYEKDYSHLGNLKFTMKKDGRERTAGFNWTTHPAAKALADEYRKIGNQYIWMFDINLSRENQPLESAKIMDALDSQIRRNEIADPVQLIPFLKQLSDDERIPLISRNHATRIVKAIEKKAAKKQ